MAGPNFAVQMNDPVTGVGGDSPMSTEGGTQMSLTQGVDHVGLTVSDLAATRDFFVTCLGWTLTGESESYPAAFVSDGFTRLTLWRVSDTREFSRFDRHRNVGLHHLAFRVPSRAALYTTFALVAQWPGVVVEFPPTQSGSGPKFHGMFREPSGNRIELAWDPRKR
jgi:catechol 2,3-dioxygenase-like lactoylglutathione lyase family enzyme